MPSPTNAPASLPAQIAVAEVELPEEIEKAIRALEIAAEKLGGHTWIAAGDGAAVIKAQALFTATILARLTAAESAREAAVAERDEARANLDKLEDTMAPLSDDGKCVWIDGSGAVPLDFSQGRDLAAALARAERAEAALEPLWQRARAPGADRIPDDATVTVFMKDCRHALAALDHPAPAEET